ncbi:hypothetical protein ACSD1U_004493 [Escherichia coli]|nr:hypothetical protein [Escherichia coli]EKY3167345.1 hypothetical protein [Cronobacter sakazakii]EFI9532445.1 hypothetical protein [Escherichia coli]EFN8102555.1 hypothetical protein [Escherichia coli]EID9838762.1 hypothetical protein [Escherichia coli]
MAWGKLAVTNKDVVPHTYRVNEPEDLPAWINAVAAEYVALRTECIVSIDSPLEITGVGIVSVESIQRRLQHACVPQSDLHKKQFSVTRSDLSEVAAYMTLEKDYSTEIGFKLTRDRELITLPGRGIDAIGIEQGNKIVVVLTEVKFSDENSAPKPPAVVDQKKDSMRNQHLAHLKEREKTTSKLFECARKTKDENLRNQYLTAAFYFEEERWDLMEVVSCCVLVRPKERQCDGDFGSFINTPDDFKPAKVRFIVISLPDSIDNIMKSWSDRVEEMRLPQ